MKVANKSKILKKFLEGSPVLIVKNGRVQRQKMKEEKLTIEDIEEAVREKGIKSIKNVETAVLETDGGISIVEK